VGGAKGTGEPGSGDDIVSVTCTLLSVDDRDEARSSLQNKLLNFESTKFNKFKIN